MKTHNTEKETPEQRSEQKKQAKKKPEYEITRLHGAEGLQKIGVLRNRRIIDDGSAEFVALIEHFIVKPEKFARLPVHQLVRHEGRARQLPRLGSLQNPPIVGYDKAARLSLKVRVPHDGGHDSAFQVFELVSCPHPAFDEVGNLRPNQPCNMEGLYFNFYSSFYFSLI